MKSPFFTAVNITSGVAGVDAAWQIRGVTIDNAYLLEGADSALLIDTLTGVGNLRSFCRELTDKPVHVALTHGHGDHAGGCFDFGQCFIHPEDIRMLYQGAAIERRKDFIASFGGPAFADTDFTPPAPLRTFPIYDGSVFELGRRRVQAVGRGTPGEALSLSTKTPV